jgi:hypothetical protein
MYPVKIRYQMDELMNQSLNKWLEKFREALLFCLLKLSSKRIW